MIDQRSYAHNESLKKKFRLGRDSNNIHNMLLQKLSEANEYIDLLDLKMS